MYMVLNPPIWEDGDDGWETTDVLDVIPTYGWEQKQGVPDLETMQGIVGGFVERVAFTEDIDLWVNEEGLMVNLPPSVRLLDGTGEPAGFLHGPVIATRHDGPETTSLREEDKVLLAFLRTWVGVSDASRVTLVTDLVLPPVPEAA